MQLLYWWGGFMEVELRVFNAQVKWTWVPGCSRCMVGSSAMPGAHDTAQQSCQPCRGSTVQEDRRVLRSGTHIGILSVPIAARLCTGHGAQPKTRAISLTLEPSD
jgi:hypothetical protein